jgi:uncharacterized small protein (TIGR04563 family)
MDADLKGSRKLSLYIPQEMLQEMEAQAIRLNRPLSWLVREAWRLARLRVSTFPDRPVLAEPEQHTHVESQQIAAAS